MKKYTPVNPSFTIYLKWDVRGSTLHGHVIIMKHHRVKTYLWSFRPDTCEFKPFCLSIGPINSIIPLPPKSEISSL